MAIHESHTHRIPKRQYNECMARVYAGIDIGTHHIKVAIAAPPEHPEAPMHIIGTGLATSKGMRHGYIVDIGEVTKGIKEALVRAQSAAGTSVHSARIALGGVSVDEIRSSGEITLTSSGGIVTERDIERVTQESEKKAAQKLVNKTVIHTIPLRFRIDGTPVIGKPHGLQGAKFGVDTLIVTMLSKHYDDILTATEAAGIEVEGVMVSSLAASLVTLTKAQKIAGVALANIGSETLSIIVFDDDTPVSVKIFPIGSSDVTSAIALSFRIPLPEAEQVKKGAVTGSDISPKKMQHVVAQELKDMFTLINAHLKTIGHQRLLPAGIVITGGGSGLPNIQDIARTILKLPATIGIPANLPRSGFADATWAVAYGLCRWAYAEDVSSNAYTMKDIWRRGKEMVRTGFRSLMP